MARRVYAAMTRRRASADPFDRLGAEAAALRIVAGGPDLSIRELVTALGVDVDEVERTWRGVEPLSIRARRRLTELLEQRATEIRALERALRKPVLRLDGTRAGRGSLEPDPGSGRKE